MINSSVLNAASLLKALRDKPGMKLRDFCDQEGFSLSYMEQIGRKLRVAGIVLTKKGPGGGYVLKQQNVSLMELLNIFMGSKLNTKNDLDAQIVKSLTEITVL